MNSINIEQESKILRYINIFHIIIIIFSIYIYCLGFNEYYFISDILYIFYKYFFLLDFIFILYPILVLVLVPLYKNNIKMFKSLKIISFCFLIIIFIIGIFINLSIWMTSAQGESFFIYCPYHYNSFLLQKIIDKYYKKNENINYNDNKLCDRRLCYFYSENEKNALAYNYICNFDSSKDFNDKNGKVHKRINSIGKEIISNTYITCTKKKKLPSSDINLITYYNLCTDNVKYLCELFEKQKEKDFTSINKIESCPGNNYTKNAFLLSLSYLLINLVMFAFLFLNEFVIIRKIEYLLQNNINKNSTINSSKNKNSHQSNSENKEDFIKEVTDFIIVENKEQKSPIIEIQQKENSTIKKAKISSIENNENEMEIKNKKFQNFKERDTNNLKLINITVLEDGEKEDNKENNNQKESEKDDLKVNQYFKNKIISNFNSNPSFFNNSEDIPTFTFIKKNKRQLNIVIPSINDNNLNSQQALK